MLFKLAMRMGASISIVAFIAEYVDSTLGFSHPTGLTFRHAQKYFVSAKFGFSLEPTLQPKIGFLPLPCSWPPKVFAHP